jgi:thiamine-monophosphate kinase
MGEFDLIERYFKRAERAAARSALVALGIGDDCALLQPRPYPHPETQLAVSTDMLVEGHHFFADVDPAALGHKALAVNLSDLAACGAKPIAFTLALALPEVNEPWLAAFSQGLFALADAHDCELIGGDTTRGPLNICITIFGEVPVINGQSQALLRSGANVGDDIYVSGQLGEASLALEVLRGNVSVSDDDFATIRQRLERPTPRVALGIALRGIATSAIDISDGLLGDLGHILQRSKVGASLQMDAFNTMLLVANNAYNAWARSRKNLETTEYLDWSVQHTPFGYILGGGDDYELAFTAPPAAREAVQAAAHEAQTPVTRIGQIESGAGFRLVDQSGNAVQNQQKSFDHFS